MADTDRIAILVRQLQGKVRWGAGDPNGAVVAPPGTMYLDSNGGALTTLWVKESGVNATGWVAK